MQPTLPPSDYYLRTESSSAIRRGGGLSVQLWSCRCCNVRHSSSQTTVSKKYRDSTRLSPSFHHGEDVHPGAKHQVYCATGRLFPSSSDSDSTPESVPVTMYLLHTHVSNHKVHPCNQGCIRHPRHRLFEGIFELDSGMSHAPNATFAIGVFHPATLRKEASSSINLDCSIGVISEANILIISSSSITFMIYICVKIRKEHGHTYTACHENHAGNKAS